MVKSKLCNLYNLSPQELIQHHEEEEVMRILWIRKMCSILGQDLSVCILHFTYILWMYTSSGDSVTPSWRMASSSESQLSLDAGACFVLIPVLPTGDFTVANQHWWLCGGRLGEQALKEVLFIIVGCLPQLFSSPQYHVIQYRNIINVL